MDSRDDIVERVPVKRGRPPKPKLKVEKILIKEEDYQYDSEENDTKFTKCAPLPESERADSVKSNSNSSRSVTIHPSLGQLENLSDEESEDEEIMSVLGTRGTSSKPSVSSVNRRGSVASRTRMPSIGKRRSKRLKKPAVAKGDSTKKAKTIDNQAPKRGRPQKCVVSLEKLSAPRLPSVVGQGVEINVDSESEGASSDAGSYTHSYNKRRLYRSSPSLSKGSGGDEGDSEDNGSYVELKTEQDESDIDGASDIDECLGGKRVRAAAAAAMELVTKKRMEAISDRDRERAERRNRKPYIKPFVPKGRSRRTIVFKRGSLKPTRGVDSIPYLTFMSSIVYKGVYFQEGDIVYILGKDERPYYCQIRHIARDWNYEAICGLLWLTPKKGTKSPFNPINYDIRDDFPEHNRKFEYVNFVMHCPLDYWYGRESSYFHPLPGTVYQRLGEPLVEVVKLPSKQLRPIIDPESATEVVKDEKVSEESPIKIETAETCSEPKPEIVPDSNAEEGELSDYDDYDVNDENMPPDCENFDIDYTEEEEAEVSADIQSVEENEDDEPENVDEEVGGETADEDAEMEDENNEEEEEAENADLDNLEIEEEEAENADLDNLELEEEEAENADLEPQEEEAEIVYLEPEEEEVENVDLEPEEEEVENFDVDPEEENVDDVEHREEEEAENVEDIGHGEEEAENVEDVGHGEEEEAENLEDIGHGEEEAENVEDVGHGEEEAEIVDLEDGEEEAENLDVNNAEEETETDDDIQIIEQEPVEMEIDEILTDPVNVDCVDVEDKSSEVEILESVQNI